LLCITNFPSARFKGTSAPSLVVAPLALLL
jgi:hypothetical protein